MGKKIRVVIADDSALMRKRIAEILSFDPDIEVVAVTRNGKEAIEAVHILNPDVVTLDVEMPVMNGLDALGYIMSEKPTPCVMISAYTQEGAKQTIRALEYGAVDFIAKPSGEISPDIKKLANEIIEKVKAAAKVSIDNLKLVWTEKVVDAAPLHKKPHGMDRVFVIASSTGGTQALSAILPQLSAEFPAGVLVVQHMPAGFTKSLAERLNWQSKIQVVEAEDGMVIKPAQVIIAKGGMHMEVGGTEEHPHVVLKDGLPRHGVKPCADIMFESAVKIFGRRLVGIVLTGMGSDGTMGAKAIKAAGGLVLAEDESTCIVYGMPKSVVLAGAVDKLVPLDKMAAEMEKLLLR